MCMRDGSEITGTNCPKWSRGEFCAAPPVTHKWSFPMALLWLGSSQQEAAWQTGGGKEWRQEGIGRTISAWSCVRPQRSQQRSRLKPKSSLWLSESVGVCVFENACLHAIAHVCMCILLGRLTCISLFSRLLTEGISQSGCLGNRSHIHNVLFTNNQQSPVLTLVFWHCYCQLNGVLKGTKKLLKCWCEI